jgi:hypothetical protein
VRTFTIAAALLLLAGCQESPPAAGPGQAPPAQPSGPRAVAGDQAPPGPPAAPPKNPLPKDQDEVKAAVMGKTRDEVLAMYGPPDETGDWGAAVGWDGPVSIYRGPFTTADGKQAAKTRFYFRQSKVASVDFTDQ